MKKLGTVIDAKKLVAHRDRRTRQLNGLNGLVIEFLTDTTITDSSVVYLTYNGINKPFNVREVEIKKDQLLGRAVECGYWAKKLEKDETLDLRSLIDCGILLVEDTDELNKIHEQSLWC